MKDEEFDSFCRAKLRHLLGRLQGICEMEGWKCEVWSRPDDVLQFWPWGADQPIVTATASIWEIPVPGNKPIVVSLSVLLVRWFAPERLASRALRETLDMCARYGVSLKIGETSRVPRLPGLRTELCLVYGIPERSLGVARVQDAVELLVATPLALSELCSVTESSPPESDRNIRS